VARSLVMRSFCPGGAWPGLGPVTGSRPDHAFVSTTGSKAAAAARIGAGLGRRVRGELLGQLRPCFARVEPWLQAGKYVAAVMSDLPRRNGWTLAERAGDRAPDRMQRLLNRAVWDTFAAMGVIRGFAVAGLDEAARKTGRRCGLAVGAIDETGQVKQGGHTAGVKRQYLGCVGKVANGINTVHLAYVREGAGHALIGAREWIPAAHIGDPVKSLVMGLPEGLVFRAKGQLAIDILAEAFADGVRLDFVCGDEVYGSCTQLREYWKTTARPTYCGSRAASRWSCPAGSRSPARRPAPGWSVGAAGRPARPGPDRRENAGTPGHGWAPPRPGITC
jgi:DDE superfamily endonuclease